MADLTQRKPYKSFILSKAKGNALLTLLGDTILDELIDCLEVDTAPSHQLITRLDAYREKIDG